MTLVSSRYFFRELISTFTSDSCVQKPLFTAAPRRNVHCIRISEGECFLFGLSSNSRAAETRQAHPVFLDEKQGRHELVLSSLIHIQFTHRLFVLFSNACISNLVLKLTNHVRNKGDFEKRLIRLRIEICSNSEQLQRVVIVPVL